MATGLSLSHSCHCQHGNKSESESLVIVNMATSLRHSHSCHCHAVVGKLLACPNHTVTKLFTVYEQKQASHRLPTSTLSNATTEGFNKMPAISTGRRKVSPCHSTTPRLLYPFTPAELFPSRALHTDTRTHSYPLKYRQATDLLACDSSPDSFSRETSAR